MSGAKYWKVVGKSEANAELKILARVEKQRRLTSAEKERKDVLLESLRRGKQRRSSYKLLKLPRSKATARAAGPCITINPEWAFPELM